MKVAVVYHYFAHYRLPIFNSLSRSKKNDYTFFSDPDSANDIKTIDPEFSKISIENGGLNWCFLKNKWFKGQLFLWQKGLLKLALKGDFDAFILLGNIFFISTWIAAVILKLRGKKVYFWTHGVTSYEKGLKWKLRSLFYNLSDGVLLYGNKAKEVMSNNGFPKNKLHVIYNSLDYEKHFELRESLNLLDSLKVKEDLFDNPKLPLIVFIGRLTHHKNLDMLLGATKLLKDKNFKINILFVGNGDAKQDLIETSKEYHLEKSTCFYGACYEGLKLAQLIGACDICVSPGEVGLTAITSLSFGTPVISHDDFNHQMPEYEAIIPKFNGDLFTRNSIDELANTIQQWIVNHKNISRNEIRANCYQVIDKKYNPLTQVELINEFISEEN